MNKAQIDELLYQALETEMGGVEVYQAAIECAENDDLKEEWEKYGRQTKTARQDRPKTSSRSSSSTPRRDTPDAGSSARRGRASSPR